MVKFVTELSIPMCMPILRLNFITKLIFIHLTIYPYEIHGKTYNRTNHIMDNNKFIFCIQAYHTLVTQLSTLELTPISPYHKPVLAVTSKKQRSSLPENNPSSHFRRIIPFRKAQNLNCCCACHQCLVHRETFLLMMTIIF